VNTSLWVQEREELARAPALFAGRGAEVTETCMSMALPVT
jgi:hypothetical protein